MLDTSVYQVLSQLLQIKEPMQMCVLQGASAQKALMSQNFVQPERLVMWPVCTTPANVLLAQRDIIAAILVKQMKQGSARLVISVSKVPTVLRKRSVQLESTVQLALIRPKTAL